MSKRKREETEVTMADVKVEGNTEILNNDEIGKKKEMRKAKQRGEIQQQLRRQGIDLGDDAADMNDVEGFYDTKAEVKKEDGVTIEPFRMDGFFNNEGRYVERAGEEADPWYQQWKDQKDKKDYKAPKAQEEKGKEENVRTPLELQKVLLKHVKPNETVLRCLKRLGRKPKQGAQPRKPWMKNKRKTGKINILSADGGKRRRGDGSAFDTGAGEKKGNANDLTDAEKQKAVLDSAKGSKQKKKSAKSEEEIARAKVIEELSSAANEMMGHGYHNIYQETYASLSEEVRKAMEQSKKSSESQEWEYVFHGDTKIHTGYSASQMQKWNKAGYFKNARVRKVGTSEWLTCEESFEFE